MSSKPGSDMESFILWNFDLVVEDRDDANWSLMMAEALGNIAPRPRLPVETFSRVVALFEPHRERVEYLLSDFDEQEQGWRQYSSCIFDSLPDKVFDDALVIIREATAPNESPL